MMIEKTDFLPPRNVYGPADTLDSLPAGVQLSTTVGAWWTVTAADETWNHVAVTRSTWHSLPQTCHTCGQTCTPAVGMCYSATERKHWCAEHADDAEQHRYLGDRRGARADGGPGWWVEIPDGKVQLIVCSKGGPRHPEFDHMPFDDAETAMRFAWRQGLLGLIVFPDLRERCAA